ncbi:hybrid sensor histidine kinase/response regulator [Flagellimonas flava]|uniref:histidine kinase n=1 Tax=Flagellimonas flava TaxID=570519 RepID=A0A1M5KFZ5_9FLAO|nr:hybrid sensor histidine kinase/response regulator [Allomuricauda flava]SHG51678.1 Response regulator receiver domain-containing protein [Allomuricauda flava]
MPLKSKNRFTLKLISGYVILGSLAVLAGIFIYSEFNAYLESQEKGIGDEELLQTNHLFTALYEAENLSKLALQNRKRSSFQSYAKKVDSIQANIETLKSYSLQHYQIQKLDSVQALLRQKVYTNAELRKLKEEENNNAPIDSLLKSFKQMEMDLGRITPEQLVPDFEELPKETQNSIKSYVEILNRNIPQKTSQKHKAQEVDSILKLSQSLLINAKTASSRIERSLIRKELQIYKNDLVLSQKLREIIGSLERDILQETQLERLEKTKMLKRSTQLAWIAGILALSTIIVFTVLTASDYWKGQLYRDRLEKEKKYSESLLRSREQLIATVSHDLRSPLQNIKGYTELLGSSLKSPRQQSYVKHLESASNYAEHLVNDLLEYTELEGGSISIENKPFRLDELLKRLTTDFSDLSISKSLPLILDVHESISQPIAGDLLRLRQILTNLLGNAFKFTEQGHIKLSAYPSLEKGKKMLNIQVMDTGIGIKKKALDFIFDEFAQAEDVRPKKQKGYGLGLTISKRLALLMGGNLSVSSEFGKGSIFTLGLPWIPVDFGLEKEVYSDAFAPNTKTSLVVIDDDESLLHLIHEICNIHNIKCHAFTSFEAFKSAPTHDFALLLTDIQMPITDGYTVAKTLKTKNGLGYTDQPIIAMTGQSKLEMDSKEAYFADVLFKPFSSHEFLNVISQYSHLNLKIPEHSEKIQPDSNSLFSTELICSFLDDNRALREVLKTFLMDTDKNLQALSKASAQMDFAMVRSIAHKMLPMFRQLTIKTMVPQLKRLELIAPENTPKKGLIREVEEVKKGFIPVKEGLQAYLLTL